MRSVLAMTVVALALVALAVAQGPQKSRSADPPVKPDTAIAATVASVATAPRMANPQDEKAIRLAAAAFATAYNAGNAKAIATLFVPEGEIVDEEGQSTQGHEGIEQAFAGVFKEHPKTHIDLAIGSIRFIGLDMAVEEGVSTVTQGPDEPAQRSPYVVVYSRQDGKWLTASARDFPDDTPTPEEQLKQLQWMIGEWVDESPEALVITSYHWSDNQCFLLGQFNVQIGGRPAMTGTHRIGWDPVAKKIRSWVFDSEGGFGEGIWTREGNQWIVKMTGVTRDGKVASSTNITARMSKDRMTWQSRDRIVGGEKTPDIEEITITRRAPAPNNFATQPAK